MLNFSVVLATYNRRKKLARCLESLFAQTYPKTDYEVIVIDDGSSDGTREFLASLNAPVQLRFFTQKNRGPAAARNRGIEVAQGELIAMTDDDCVPPRDWLEKLEDGFRRYPEVVGVGGYQEAPAEILERNPVAQYERYQTREIYGAKGEEIVGGWTVPGGVTNNVAFRREILLEVGGFDENFPVAAGEDADLKKRITDCGYKMLYLPLKVEHHQDYSLRGYLRQQYARGVGAMYFRWKWESRRDPQWGLIAKAIPRFFVTWMRSRSLRVASVELLGRIWIFVGELKGGQDEPGTLAGCQLAI